MESDDVKRLGLILAVQAEIEGMKAENETSRLNILPPTFCQAYFQEKAEELRNLAYCHNEQL